MAKEKTNNNAELNALLYSMCVKLLQNNTKQIISFYNFKKEILSDTILAHREKEPLKIFKTSHEEWANREKELYQDLHETENNLIKEIEYLEDLKKMMSFD